MAVILFDGMTSLDLLGFFDAATRLRMLQALDQVEWDFCAIKEEIVDSCNGERRQPTPPRMNYWNHTARR